MKINKFIPSVSAVSVMLLAAACSDDPQTPAVTPTPGAEVNFGASMTTNDTRTVYGEESGGAFPIYWENGDLVTVMSPGADYEIADYKISATESSTQDYASGMTKTGDAGIQWGNAEKANFYSIYPAGQVQSVNTSNNTMTLRMPHMQNDYIDASAGATNVIAKADMKGGFLYAQTIGVDNGTKTVNLAYKPLATALRFKLQGPKEAQGSESTASQVIISNIRIQAPSGTVIAGNFDVEFATEEGVEPTIKNIANLDEDNGFDYVTIYSSYEGSEGGGYLTLRKDESVTLNAFLIPQSNLIINDDWKIIVVLSDGRTCTLSLGGTATGNKNMILKPGQIHNLPDLPPLNISTETNYDPSNWMVYIPRNTYLSEISIPGSWNSLNTDAQSDTDISHQYNVGIRAFHLDTRWKSTRNPVVGDNFINGNVPIGDLSIADGSSSNSVYQNAALVSKNLGKVMNSDAPTFASSLSTIVEQVKDDEYMVVMCTYAQGSYNNPQKQWYQSISETCASEGKIYDARQLTSKTVVGDVLGKVIVIVCMEDSVASMTELKDSKCLFTKAPLTLDKSMFASGYQGNKDLMYYGSKTSSGITLYNTQAQICGNASSINTNNRGYGPSLAERQAVGNNILNWSRENYLKTDYTSSNWIYLGIGGYINDGNDYKTVASSMNDWINGKVTNMSARPTGNQTTYYPVGIVLMNQVLSYTGTVNNILQLNNKYQKAYNPDWTGPVDNATRAPKNPNPNGDSGFSQSENWSITN